MNKEQFLAQAKDAGWTVTGHNWLRLTRGDEEIEVWYAGRPARMVSATMRALSGRCRQLNIARDRATPLVDSVMLWVAGSHPMMDLQLMRVVAPPTRTPAPAHAPIPAQIPTKVAGDAPVVGNVAVPVRFPASSQTMAI